MNSPSLGYLLPRNSLLWMLLAVTASLIPLLSEIPLWLPVMWLGVLYWRLKIFLGHWNQPARMSKFLLVSACVIALYSSFGKMQGLEPMVALLICAILLKILEMHRQRDALLVVFLGYFFIATQFLFAQTLMANLYGILCLWLVTTALLAIYQPAGHALPRRSLRLSGRLLIHTLPLMLLLFLVMPRIDSLWSVPSPQHSAKTGVSDSMSPGQFSKLSRSGGVAFRASFDGEMPARSDLYWRGLVFSYFDGVTWMPSQAGSFADGSPISNINSTQSWRKKAQGLGDGTNYQVILEASQQPWLYSLQLPTDYRSEGKILSITRDFTLIAQRNVSERLSYTVTSHLQHLVEVEGLMGIRRERELRLPKGFNPQSLAQAEKWLNESDSEQHYIDRVLAFFSEQLSYTIEPPRMGRHSVDDFLFGSQQGFCEHFASAFVVMMRAANIPARVVAGYQGGEFNELERYLLVHQYDAHAWAEVWLSGRGWVRVDPTAAVAPERILSSLGDAQTDSVESYLSLGRYRHISLLNAARLQWDALNYRWYQTVMGFNQDQQQQLLSRWLNGVTTLKMMLLVLGCGALVIGFVSLHLWWSVRPKPLTPQQQSYQRFERLMAGRGLVRHKAEAPDDFARRAGAVYPLLANGLHKYTEVFIAAEYADKDFDAHKANQLLTRLKQQIKSIP